MSINFNKFSPDSLFLVTGVAGFIGSNIAEHLLNNGMRVRGIDNLSSGKLENILPFLNNRNFEFQFADIRDFESCQKACHSADYVLHEAALGSVSKSLEAPLLYNDNNICGTLNMMEASRIANVRKFVYASSSSVYGNCEVLPSREGCEGTPLVPYALTKRVDEEYGKLYKECYGLDTYALRYFNVYGKRQAADSEYSAVIPKFIKQLLDGIVPTIFGDGKQERDFTYIDDVVNANILACLASKDCAGEVFNISCGNPISISNVFAIISNLLGSNNPHLLANSRKGEIKKSWGCTEKAQLLLGFAPNHSFNEGIEKTVNWYLENHKNHQAR